MNLDLNNKVVLVTGGSKGIGLACLDAFLAEGAKVAICSRSQENLADAKSLRSGIFCFAGDLIDANSAKNVVSEVEKNVGPIDILVNSAGAARRTPPNELTPEVWRSAMDAKYFTYINVIDPVVKLMAARRRGVIVNIIGLGGKYATPIHLPGGAANAALMLATAGLGSTYAPQGIRVVGVNPGLTATSRVAEGLAADAKLANITEEQALAKFLERMPAGRMATPEEIANSVVFLASDRAAYINGTTISVDGGMIPTVV